MNRTVDTMSAGLTQAWTSLMTFLPAFLLFLVILVVGYYLAKLVGKVITAILHRLDFNRVGQRAPFKRMMGESNYDWSAILGKIVKWTLFVFVLQIAFGIFGPNPINTILTNFILYLPNIFFALAIVVLASLLASAVQRLLQSSLANVSFGRLLATVAAGFIMAVGIFAALDELGVARVIVAGLFYAMLAIIVGSSIIAIGCGGIVPMRAQWETFLGRLRREGTTVRSGVAAGSTRAEVRSVTEEERRAEAEQASRFTT